MAILAELTFQLIGEIAAIFLVPLVVASVMYRVLPRTQSQAQGTLSGLKVKLGGSMATYMLLLLVEIGCIKALAPPDPSEINKTKQDLETVRAAKDSLQKSFEDRVAENANLRSQLSKYQKLESDYATLQKEKERVDALVLEVRQKLVPTNGELWTVSGLIDFENSQDRSLRKKTISIVEIPHPTVLQDGSFKFNVLRQRVGGENLELPTLSVEMEGFQTVIVHLEQPNSQFLGEQFNVALDEQRHLADIRKKILLQRDPYHAKEGSESDIGLVNAGLGEKRTSKSTTKGH